MFFCEAIVLDTIFILFPILIYFLFAAYKKDLNKEQKLLLLDVANYSTLYLLVRFDYLSNNNIYLMLLVNVPLLVSFLYNRKVASFIISFIIVGYYVSVYNINIIFLLCEYILYYVLFIFAKLDIKKHYYIFIFIKGVILSIIVVYIFPDDNVMIAIFKTFSMLIIFYLVTCLSIGLIGKADDTMNLNNVLSELEKEKELKNSLFKITHEVKNPISVCLGYLSMMNYEDIEKVKKYNGIIKEEIDRTLSIMDDFNSYSKINIKFERVDLCLLISDVVGATSSLTNSYNIELVVDAPYDNCFINGDFNKLKQVLVNLIKNSVEAMNKGIIKVSLRKKTDKVYICVNDNGHGMDRDTLKRIGEMFYTTKDNGTGLGVCMSMEIIKRHGGILKYKSRINHGTCATIIL